MGVIGEGCISPFFIFFAEQLQYLISNVMIRFGKSEPYSYRWKASKISCVFGGFGLGMFFFEVVQRLENVFFWDYLGRQLFK